MKHLWICLFLPITLFANIIESMTIRDVDHHYQDETLILYDLDNTLIQLTQILGSDEWFYFRYKHLTKEYGDQERALQRAIGEWIAAQTLSDVAIVEEGSAEMIDKQQKKGVALMGLTTRDCSMAMCTLNQLKKLDIDLQKTAPCNDSMFYVKNDHGVLFQHGVLFTSAMHKGECFLEFLKRANYTPKRVIFINDKYANIKQVADTCYERGIDFLGLRYGYLDQKVAMFNTGVAEIQMYNFGNILSDEEAYKLYLENQLTNKHPVEEEILRAKEV